MVEQALVNLESEAFDDLRQRNDTRHGTAPVHKGCSQRCIRRCGARSPFGRDARRCRRSALYRVEFAATVMARPYSAPIHVWNPYWPYLTRDSAHTRRFRQGRYRERRHNIIHGCTNGKQRITGGIINFDSIKKSEQTGTYRQILGTGARYDILQASSSTENKVAPKQTIQRLVPVV